MRWFSELTYQGMFATDRDRSAAIHGYVIGFRWAAAIFAIGFLLALIILPFNFPMRTRTTGPLVVEGGDTAASHAI